MLGALESAAGKTYGHSLPGRLWAFALHCPDKVALREKSMGIWQPYTWLQYAQQVQAAAAGLQALGCSSGDRVAILSENRTQWLFADLAAQALGVLSAGIYPTNPAQDVAYVIQHCQAKIVFCEDQEQVDKVLEQLPHLPLLEHIVVFEPRGTLDYTETKLITWQLFLEQGEQWHNQQVTTEWFANSLQQLDADAAAIIIYTSGTTGVPKGALLSQHNALSQVAATAEQLGITEHDTMLSYLPLCHVAEKIFTNFLPLTQGCVVHFGESIDTVKDDLVAVSPTVFLGVPRIWEKLHAGLTLRLQHASPFKRRLANYWLRRAPEFAEAHLNNRLTGLLKCQYWVGHILIFAALKERIGLGRCKLALSGAAPIAPELLYWFFGIGLPISEGYAMTESAGAGTFNKPNEWRLGSVGTVVADGLELALADDGEVLFRGANVFLGYLDNPTATAETMDADGWLHTGDLGKITAGYLSIVGRKKEIMITAGGKNLAPAKIENRLKMSPYIKEAIAIGDSRPFVSALIQIDYDLVAHWAGEQGIAFASFTQLTEHPAVLTLLEDAVANANQELARVEQVRAIRLLPDALHQDDGDLTATQKVRRQPVIAKYQALITAMYEQKRS